MPDPRISILPFLRARDCDLLALTAHQEAALAACAEPLALSKGALIYHAGDPLEAIYNLEEGVVKTCAPFPGGGLRVAGFLGAGDLFGLAEDGRYVHSAAAVTAVRLFRFAIRTLVNLLWMDPSLDLTFLLKLCGELREADRHAALLMRKDAIGRLAMFLDELRREPWGKAALRGALFLPMSYADIASYAGLTREALSRAFHRMERAGIIAFSGRRRVAIKDERRFARLAAGAPPEDVAAAFA
jgi:CRP-like cAMP-binding protein